MVHPAPQLLDEYVESGLGAARLAMEAADEHP
jgi:hypothetical protein